MIHSIRMKLPLLLLVLGVPALAPCGAASAQEWNVPTPHPDRVVLTWADDPTSTQSVTWRTDTTVTTALAQVVPAVDGPGFEPDATTVSAETQRVDGTMVPDSGVVAHYHSATFTNLRPDALYAYRVGDGTRWTEWFQFRTASREPKPFTFLYFGDAQNNILSHWSRTLRSGYAAAPDARFMLHAGDLVNNGQNEREWGEWFRAGGWLHAMVPSMPAPGNHEYDPVEEDVGGVEAEELLSIYWRPQFALPTNGVEGLDESNYYFDYQGLRVLVLNSLGRFREQADWMERVLADNPNRWTVATFHHPVFSSASDRDNPELRAAWQPVFERHGVDLVLQGHDHTYARGRTTAAGRAPATTVTHGSHSEDTETGPVYVVSVGGPKMYEFKKQQWDAYDAELDRHAENTQLFQVIRVDGDTLRYEARTVTGELYDSFHLIKGVGANRLLEPVGTPSPTRGFTDPPAYRR